MALAWMGAYRDENRVEGVRRFEGTFQVANRFSGAVIVFHRAVVGSSYLLAQLLTIEFC